MRTQLEHGSEQSSGFISCDICLHLPGLEVTRQLMAKGAHVIMACRDMPACEAAAEKLRLASKEAKGTGTCSCAQLVSAAHRRPLATGPCWCGAHAVQLT
jgi:hypothetical protein